MIDQQTEFKLPQLKDNPLVAFTDIPVELYLEQHATAFERSIIEDTFFFQKIKHKNEIPFFGTAIHLGKGYFVTAWHVFERAIVESESLNDPEIFDTYQDDKNFVVPAKLKNYRGELLDTDIKPVVYGRSAMYEYGAHTRRQILDDWVVFRVGNDDFNNVLSEHHPQFKDIEGGDIIGDLTVVGIPGNIIVPKIDSSVEYEAKKMDNVGGQITVRYNKGTKVQARKTKIGRVKKDFQIDELHYQIFTSGGFSGGPVILNKEVLIGIITHGSDIPQNWGGGAFGPSMSSIFERLATEGIKLN